MTNRLPGEFFERTPPPHTFPGGEIGGRTVPGGTFEGGGTIPGGEIAGRTIGGIGGINSDEAAGFIATLQVFFPGMPMEFITAAANAWATHADAGMDVALATLRADPRYEVWFPGNLAPDGTVHLREGSYWVTRRQHADVITQLGMDSSVFSDADYVSLIAGDVDVAEFEDRVRTLSNGILARADGIREYFALNFGATGISDAAILESAFTGNADSLRRAVGQATVGFEGDIRGFDVGLQVAASIFDAGITSQGQAQELFGQAAAQVPLFGRLAERHFDPDDDFDLGEFLEAAVFDDREQQDRIRRLLSQERAQFSAFRPLRGQRGAITGLTPQ
jgi:hypothetical protein